MCFCRNCALIVSIILKQSVQVFPSMPLVSVYVTYLHFILKCSFPFFSFCTVLLAGIKFSFSPIQVSLDPVLYSLSPSLFWIPVLHSLIIGVDDCHGYWPTELFYFRALLSRLYHFSDANRSPFGCSFYSITDCF